MNEIYDRLVRVFGATRGHAIYQDILVDLALDEIRSPADEMRFAGQLIVRGGLYESLGSALRVRALLNGAPRDKEAV